MKRGLLILTIVAAACSGKITITESDIKPDVFYTEGSLRPFTGKCSVVFSNASLIKEEFTYKHGLLHGRAMAWYENGQLRRRGYYSKGQITGKWEFWDEKGSKTLEAHYNHDELNGAYISYYPNGQIREKGQFTGNRRTGEWLYYNEIGQPVSAGLR